MTKAKTIDRLEWTRRKFSRPQQIQQDVELPILTPEDFAFGIQHDVDRQNNTHNGDICPNCKQPTLIHIEGCERCSNCGYDACAWREV